MNDFAFINARLQEEISKTADDPEGMIRAQRRNPDREPSSEAERLCKAFVKNEQAWMAHRQELAAQRAALNSVLGLGAKRSLNKASFQIHDRETGRVVTITLMKDGLSWQEAS